MSDSPLSFDAVYAPQTVSEAAHAFRDYQFKRYGLLFASACAINAAGLAVMHWSGAAHDAAFFGAVFAVVLGPIFMLYQYEAPRI